MRLVGPDVFSLRVSPARCEVLHTGGIETFSGRSAGRLPKLYVVSTPDGIEYVGVTKQPLSTRIRLGWTATGESGYHGYAWRHTLTEATLSVWYHEDAVDRSCADVETIEAEVVFLVRQSGQWPAGQTEIHFHPSTATHRDHAKRVFDTCRGIGRTA